MSSRTQPVSGDRAGASAAPARRGRARRGSGNCLVGAVRHAARRVHGQSRAALVRPSADGLGRLPRLRRRRSREPALPVAEDAEQSSSTGSPAPRPKSGLSSRA